MDGPARRLWALVQGLPPDAATWRENVDGWSQTDHLLAAQIEITDMWGRLIASPHYRKGSLPGPVQITRPGQQEGPRGNVVTDPAELARWFARNR